MTIAPLQAWGLGDILFTQSIAHKWIEEGHKVVWGTLPEWVDGLNRAYPKVKFVDQNTLPIDYNRNDEHDANGYRVVPLRWSDSLMNVPYERCMESKFMLFGLDYKEWKFMFQRDAIKETILYANMPKQYNLINCNYQSDFKGKKQIQVSNGLPNIYMEKLPLYSLFDWAKVIENAAEIHTVSTSLFYLLELLPLAQPIHLYPRPNDPKFKHIDYLFSRDYILH